MMNTPLWYLGHAMRTMGATLLGFIAALVVGCLAAIGIVYSRVLEYNALFTLLVALNSVPKIALTPLFIIWMGTGLSSKVALSFLIALFASVVDTVLGLRSGDPDAVDLFRSLRGDLQTLLWLWFPTALPHLFAGMKVTISLAPVGAIAGEFVASGGAWLRHPIRAGAVPDDARVRGRGAARGRRHPIVLCRRYCGADGLSLACLAWRARPRRWRGIV